MIFNLYRYQILPKDRHFQGLLFGDITTVEDLISKKNTIFYEQLKSISEWKNKRTSMKGQLIYDKNDFLLFRFAPKRTVKIENETFEEKEYENWPSILVAIWNKPDKQFMLIQDRKQSFSNTKSVLNIITKSLNETTAQPNKPNPCLKNLIFKKYFFSHL